MNLKGISYFISLFCLPVSFLAFINLLFSSYFNYFLSLDSYLLTLAISLISSLFFYLYGKKGIKKINFYEQLILIILIYIITAIFISIPYYLSNYQITFVNSLFESFSGLTGTGFTTFENIKYLDPTLILWRSASQWIGGLFFLVFLVLFFNNVQFNYKLNDLVYSGFKNSDIETSIKKISINIFFIYSLLTLIIFVLISLTGVRLFNGLNLSMTLISNGGFLPTNNLNQIIKNNTQEIVLILSFIIATFNIYFFLNIFTQKKILKLHYEDFSILFFAITSSIFLFIFSKNSGFTDVLIATLSSINTSGLYVSNVGKNFSLFLLFLTLIGGSLMSTSSGIKYLRIFILLKASFIEIFKLVKPNNVINQSILYSDNKITPTNVKLSFFIFVSFFLSLFILSGILLLDSINFENSFKLSILTITNTVSSGLYGLSDINFSTLLTSSKIFIIIFMIIGKIELLSIFLIIKKVLFKN